MMAAASANASPNNSACKGIAVHAARDVSCERWATVATLPRLPESPQPIITKQRNGNDVIALLSLIIGHLLARDLLWHWHCHVRATSAAVPLLLGSIGLAGAKNASKPDQARLFSWIGIVGGAGFIAVVLLIVVGSVAFGTTSLNPTLYSSGFATPTPAP